ncbi:MAG: LysR family transcriptional regulator [Hyphomicrobiales bacterium]|nr:MAG: LysR family transcriptional regulator [Hyphomicrobiales bacterium]
MTKEKPNSHSFNLRHLRAFRAVAEKQSISAASEQVFLSQPAITQAIAKLEGQLGAALFDRRSDGMVPSGLGRAFQARTGRALEFIHAGTREAMRLGARKGRKGFTSFDQLLTSAQLRALIAVSNAKNFSLAARAMGVSQPTVHRAARDLERLSGLTLFVKSNQGIELTSAAHALAQAVKLAFAELEQGITEIAEMTGVDSGRIVIGSMPLPRSFILPSAINALLAERPEIAIQVIDGPYNDLLHGLRHGEIDVLVGALRNPVPIDDVVQEALFIDPLVVVGRTGHPLHEKDRISLDDLRHYPWAIPRRGTPTRASFEAMFEGGERPGSLVESSSLVLIRGLLQGSDRLTLISSHQIRHEQQLHLLAPIPFTLQGTQRPIGLTLRRDWQPTAAQNLFLEHLRQAGRRAGQEAVI